MEKAGAMYELQIKMCRDNGKEKSQVSLLMQSQFSKIIAVFLRDLCVLWEKGFAKTVCFYRKWRAPQRKFIADRLQRSQLSVVMLLLT